jgi:succinyl-CoA synthetase beta subunit
MDLYEYEGKKLFREYNIPIPKSILLKGNSVPKHLLTNKLMLKAQILRGKRRKHGLIKATTNERIKKDIKVLRNKTKQPILIEEQLQNAKEYYLSLTINQSKSCYSFLFSEEGGIDVEEVPKTKIKQYDFYSFKKNEIQKITKNKEIIRIAEKLWKLFKEKDATLVEINPLIETSGTDFIAADAKITIDDNALYRQPELEKMNKKRKTEEEKKAEEYGIHYIKLDGDIGVIGNGAGLVMATLDLLNQNNLRPANFLDAAGGTTKNSLQASLDILLKDKNIKAIFINMFGGITKTDDIAEAVVAYKKTHKTKIPFVIRLYGTNYQRAHTILKENNIKAYTKVEDAIASLKAIK